jgi:hypothetical protein
MRGVYLKELLDSEKIKKIGKGSKVKYTAVEIFS